MIICRSAPLPLCPAGAGVGAGWQWRRYECARLPALRCKHAARPATPGPGRRRMMSTRAASRTRCATWRRGACGRCRPASAQPAPPWSRPRSRMTRARGRRWRSWRATRGWRPWRPPPPPRPAWRPSCSRGMRPLGAATAAAAPAAKRRAGPLRRRAAGRRGGRGGGRQLPPAAAADAGGGRGCAATPRPRQRGGGAGTCGGRRLPRAGRGRAALLPRGRPPWLCARRRGAGARLGGRINLRGGRQLLSTQELACIHCCSWHAYTVSVKSPCSLS